MEELKDLLTVKERKDKRKLKFKATANTIIGAVFFLIFFPSVGQVVIPIFGGLLYWYVLRKKKPTIYNGDRMIQKGG